MEFQQNKLVKTDIVQKYQDTLKLIRDHSIQEVDQSIVEEIIGKLQRFYREKGEMVKQPQDFDNQFEQTLNSREKDIYDNIVIEAEDKKQILSQGTLGNQQQIHQDPKSKFQSQAQYTTFPNLFEKFDETVVQLIELRGRPDLREFWLKSQNRVVFYKKLQLERQNNSEFIERFKVIDSFNHYYSNILLNYLEIPSKNNEKLRNRQGDANKLIKKVLDLVTDIQQVVVPKQQEFFNSLINIKYFYKFYKLRNLSGKGRKNQFIIERESQVSIKKILLKHIQTLCQQYQLETFERSKSSDLKEILKQLYQQLKVKTNETEYAQLFDLIKEIKICYISYYKFRTFFLHLVQIISIEFRNQAAIADILISQCMNSLQLILTNRDRKELHEYTEYCWQMVKNFDLESLVGTQITQIKEKFDQIEARLRRINQSSKVIGGVLESLLNLTTNKVLELSQEYLKSNKSWIKPNEIFNDVHEWEVRWLTLVKDNFGDIKEFYREILMIRPKEYKGLQADQKQYEEKKQEIYSWIEFIHTKKNRILDQLININNEKTRLDAQRIIDYYMFDDPEEILKNFELINKKTSDQKDREIIEIVRKILDQERRISDIMRDFMQKFQVNLEKSDKQQFQLSGEIFKYHLTIVLKSQPTEKKLPGQQVNNYFYYPAAFNFYLYFQKDSSSFLVGLQDYVERFRFVTLGLCLCEKEQGQLQGELNKLIDCMSHQDKQITIESYLQNLTLEFQYLIAQKLFNHAAQHYNLQNDPDKLELWNDLFPFNKAETKVHSIPSSANSIKFNLSCFVAQLVIQQRTESRLYKNVEQIHRLIKFIKSTEYSTDDFKLIPEFNKIYSEQIQKYYQDVKNYKNSSEKELQNYQSTSLILFRLFQKELYEIFSKYFTKSTIFRQVEKFKIENKIPLNRDEIVYQTQTFWEAKLFQLQQQSQTQSQQQSQSQSQSQQSSHRQTHKYTSNQVHEIKEKFLLFMSSIKKIDKDGHEFYKDLKSQIGLNQDQFIKDNIPDFYKLLDKYFIQTQIVTASPPIVIAIPAVIQPKAQRPCSFINQSLLISKLTAVRKKYSFPQPAEEEQTQLVEFIQEKFFLYMKQFLGKVFQAAVAQNAGDEIKVYQTQSGGGLQQMLEGGDKTSEIRIKQLTDLFQNYGPKKDGDYDTTLLTSADQPSKQGQYTLCDLTPISRQQDFGKYLIEVDRQSEALLKNRIRMKKWRDDKPELQDILSKKIKRGTDLGDAVQSFLFSRIQSEQEKDEGEVEQEPEDESEKIKTMLLKSLKLAQDTSATTTRTIMQNRLRNMESNNHLVKRKEISVKTVQSVLESMPLYKKSKILQKSYLF